MASPEVYSLAQGPVTAHAFNQNRSQVAVSLNSTDVQIFSKAKNDWKATETLSEHDKLITSIDWAPNSNRIVTASQDRNAYVWTQTPDPQTGRTEWKPTLVLLNINRAATFVRWSPLENKFAVASGARAIAICSFDEESNWWVSKLLKKPIRSTVLSIDWHPNNVLLAAGSADMKARVFSAYIKDVDKKPAPTFWGEKLPFGTVCSEFASPAGGWVHTVSFSPSGDVLAFAGHDSTISIAYPASGAVRTVRITTLPLVTLVWASEDSIVAAGHDCQPYVFSGNENGWKLIGSLDDTSAPKSTLTPSRFGPGGPGRLNSAAFNTFKNADSRGIGGAGGGGGATSQESELLTVHQNTITSVRPYDGESGAVTRVSTTGVDGKLVIWNVGSVTTLTAKLGSAHLR